MRLFRLSGGLVAPVLLLGGVLGAGPASAQTQCDLVGSNYFRTLTTSSGDITFVSRPVIRCRDGTRIQADSAEIFSARSFSQFFGRVEFRDSATVLTTDRANFFSREGRLQAWGSVVLTDQAEGSRITGDTLLYLRPIEARPTEQITVTGNRPHATLYPAPAEAADSVEAAEAARAEEEAEASPDRPGREGGRAQAVQDLREQIAPAGADSVMADSAEVAPDTAPAMPPLDPDTGRTREPDSVPGEPVADSLEAGPDSVGAVPDSAVAGAEAEGDEEAEEGAEPQDGVSGPAAAPSEPEDTVRTPYEVDADRIFLEGERYFRATGNVEVLRDSMEAYGDSVEYDQRAGRLFIMDSARLLAADYVLLGRIITLVLPAGEIDQIVSRDDAELTGEDLRLTAPEIRLYMTEGRAERLVAVHRDPEPDTAAAGRGGRDRSGRADSVAAPPRPRAVATQFLLVADSIEAQTPGEILERVVATGRARGESLARDSLNTPETPEIARRDWLEGDTVVAEFEPDTTEVRPDTARPGYRLERVTAMSNARSLYRMEPADSAQSRERMALHYVQGQRISIQMEGGEVRQMEVQGQTRGMYLEPVRRARADTASARGPGSSGREGEGP